MSEQDMDLQQIEAKVHDLAEAMDKVRDSQASRSDVVVDMKQAAHARLELLAQDLQPVFRDLPDDNDQFEFALTNGEPPRLWIDMTSFVRMGRDRRNYEFVKDTRFGRTLIASSLDRETIGAIVTDYVAERVLERERMLEGDWVALKGHDFESGEKVKHTRPISTFTSRVRESGYGWELLGWFALGLLGGAAAMVLWAWYGEVPLFLR